MNSTNAGSRSVNVTAFQLGVEENRSLVTCLLNGQMAHAFWYVWRWTFLENIKRNETIVSRGVHATFRDSQRLDTFKIPNELGC